MATEYIQATGRRKTAIARVQLFANGEGTIIVNKKPFDEYFSTDAQRTQAVAPLLLTDKRKSVTIKALVDGGGPMGQAEALRHGLSRALEKLDPQLRAVLKKEGFLTRDPRMKERKKPGQPGARKRFQYSKR